ncbi:hypothetical protein [Priestia koreensis]|uniref:hypothetical protein n=1 Tax=Priestia koreensis TaxID=284581 RepID=UPI00203B4C72|nr:hypothetical protein [Priestia koreensis]MCM3004946.1 hypothetical protein [Priestia koreensis]
MKGFFRLLIGVLFTFALTGCFGEDYDVGVPTAHLSLESKPSVKLTEGNISWSSSSGDVNQRIGDVQKFGLSQDKIKISPGEQVFLDFQENEENGGDIWTDPTLKAVLLNGKQRIELKMDDHRELKFPSNKGSYILAVEFVSSRGTAQYVGNISIQ